LVVRTLNRINIKYLKHQWFRKIPEKNIWNLFERFLSVHTCTIWLCLGQWTIFLTHSVALSILKNSLPVFIKKYVAIQTRVCDFISKGNKTSWYYTILEVFCWACYLCEIILIILTNTLIINWNLTCYFSFTKFSI
jgi:hypothetical protein